MAEASAKESERHFGPMAVALLALKDRDFFARLVKDPKAAVNDVAVAKLRLTDEEKREVIDLINERNRAYPRKDPLPAWDRYQKSGTWDNGDWMKCWPQFRTAPRG